MQVDLRRLFSRLVLDRSISWFRCRFSRAWCCLVDPVLEIITVLSYLTFFMDLLWLLLKVYQSINQYVPVHPGHLVYFSRGAV